MRAYTKGLIILCAIFILPTFASADEPADMDDLDVTMTVIESPQDSPAEITNRIEVPSEQYLQARERNRHRDETHRMDGNRDRDHEAMEGSREMMQEQMQAQHQEMMQEQQQDMMQDLQQDMMQMQQEEMVQQHQDMQSGSGGPMGGGHGMGM